MILHKKERQQALDFLRRFRLVGSPIVNGARSLPDMGAEDVEYGLARLFGVFRFNLRVLRQLEEFVGPSQTHHGSRCIPQVLNGVFQAFLPLSPLSVQVGICLFLCGLGLCLCSTALCFCSDFHCPRSSVRCQSLQGKQNAAHADSEEFEDLEFVAYAETFESPCGTCGPHDNHKGRKQHDEKEDKNEDEDRKKAHCDFAGYWRFPRTNEFMMDMCGNRRRGPDCLCSDRVAQIGSSVQFTFNGIYQPTPGSFPLQYPTSGPLRAAGPERSLRATRLPMPAIESADSTRGPEARRLQMHQHRTLL